ncbi:hypothetical protein ACP4OV_023608 [Aristida adscensionis]
MASSSAAAALKLAAACVLVLWVALDLARPAAQAMTSPPPAAAGGDLQLAAAARALAREALERADVAGALGLRRGDDDDVVAVGDVCSVACQTCLTVCAVSCVLNKEPVSCFVNCTVTGTCFGKPAAA